MPAARSPTMRRSWRKSRRRCRLTARAYDPDDRAWTISAPYIARVVELISAVYPDVIVDDRFTAGAAPARSVAIDPDFAELHLLATAPPELVETAYRCLSRIHHPDTGGDHHAMQRLNEAVAIIRQRVSA